MVIKGRSAASVAVSGYVSMTKKRGYAESVADLGSVFTTKKNVFAETARVRLYASMGR